MSAPRSQDITVEVFPDDPKQLLASIRDGLSQSPRVLAPRFFYDDRGSALFEQICELPEYYQTRTEGAILKAAAPEIASLTGANTLVELGSGAASKTRMLLDALSKNGSLERYVPIDVSEWIVRRVAGELVEEYPGTAVHGQVLDFTEDLATWPRWGRELVIFLGGTIGNFTPADGERFLTRLASHMESGDGFLVGADLIKDPAVLHAAYNDKKGVTAEFNKNALAVLNRLVDGNFKPDRFTHRAVYNRDLARIEMWLHSEQEQAVRLDQLDFEFVLAAGEEILTEISAKFDRERLTGMLDRAGFDIVRFYTDEANLFSLTLAKRR